MKYKIRKATIEDLKIIQELNKKLCIKEFQEFDDTIDPNYPMTQKGENYFRKRIEDKENSLSYVATDGDKVIGYFIGGINEEEDYRTITKIGEGETTFVEKEYRGKGIGTEFMRLFEEWAREKGIKRLRYIASSRNKNAIKLYKELGCEEYDIILEKVLK